MVEVSEVVAAVKEAVDYFELLSMPGEHLHSGKPDSTLKQAQS